jgi:hypothetical protein
VSRRETGQLWESAVLVEVIDGERVPTLQVTLSRLYDDRWRVFGQELPRGSGRQVCSIYATEAEARDVAEKVYEANAALGEWQTSRFGHAAYEKPTRDGRPHW